MADEYAGAPADLTALTADIVSAYVARNHIQPAELPALLQTVHGALGGLGRPAAAQPETLTPPVPIRRTVTPDAIISLEDGRPYKTLKRHLAGRGLTPEEYRRKWGLPHDYPMTAANYAAQRSELAKSIGLGRSREAAAAAKATAADEVVSAPAEGAKPGRRGRKAA
ncbi:Transcriptional regulatory protein ros [Methylobacterium crusticola]|uniref:Transcriptional regulatory protein ros n=1 Tax=Methylobacterium crusticola TaxID=1697972 RepID=A0ABQ4QUI3_9HYPH|nr:MucR family transcriptional regulator [Methylobacterium crusticola]GJD48247.1 Transcriptional regulatory protein ros [Methylobacterium crusticola]